MTSSPQNPYESYMVEASAGTGKTYQLSKRFLFLVGAGAAPGSILTITFTVKAAGEMRARILEEATRLLSDPAMQQDFDHALATFYAGALASPNYSQSKPRVPRSAIETAKEVLSSTQLLKISTIDSLFNQWVGKFPWESGIDNHGQNQMPTPFRIIDSISKGVIDAQAWHDVFAEFNHLQINPLDILSHYEPAASGPLGVIKKVVQLDRQNSYLWKRRQEANAEVYLHPKPSDYSDPVASDHKELIRSLRDPLTSCAIVTANADEILTGIGQEDINTLVQTKLLTKDWTISGIKIKGKKREALAREIEQIERTMRDFRNEAKIKALNNAGLALYQLYVSWTNAREARKAENKFIEFGDLSKGAYRLFNREDGLGATWLIQRTVCHLMIDEFQDTSLLQWSIFRKLSEELLSGQYSSNEHGVGSSVFIVGDAKQSIYGFREGDPIVLEKARSTFRDFGKSEIPLDNSFRSSQVVLDLVNSYFSDGTLANFRMHKTAADNQGRVHVPNCGGVTIRQLFTKGDQDLIQPVKQEAEYLAAELRQALEFPERYPVYDKKSRSFRPLTPADCCLLYRSATNVAIFEDALRNAGLPCRKAEQKGFFDRQEIQDTVALLSFLARPADALALITFLKSPMAMLNDNQVLALIHKTKEANDDALASMQILAVLFEENPSLYHALSRLLKICDRQLPHEVLLASMRDFNSLQRYQDCFQDAEGDLASSNLLKLVELCCEFEEQGHTNLSACLDHMKRIAKKDEHGSAQVSSQAITLMTVHKSKGLEFPFVAIVEMGTDWFKVDQYWLKTDSRESGIAYVGTKETQPNSDANFDSILASQKAQLQAEAQRLLYVALTRASHYLLITGSEPGTGGKDSFFPRLWQSLQSLANSRQVGPCLAISTVDNFSCSTNAPRPSSRLFASVSALAALKSPMLHELAIIHPSDSEAPVNPLSKREPALPDPYHLTPLLGNVLHRCFEHWFRYGQVDLKQIWLKEFRQKLPRKIAGTLDDRALLATTEAEFFHCLESPAWQQLLQGASRFLPEMEVVQHVPGKLIRGTVDLLIQYSDNRLRILDYKTAPYLPLLAASSVNREEDLRLYCVERGYDHQLTMYVQGVQQLFPACSVEYGVWLTKERAWVPLGTASPKPSI